MKTIDLLHKYSEKNANQAAMDIQLKIKMNEKLLHQGPGAIRTGEKNHSAQHSVNSQITGLKPLHLKNWP